MMAIYFSGAMVTLFFSIFSYGSLRKYKQEGEDFYWVMGAIILVFLSWIGFFVLLGMCYSRDD